jgi:uncharacterized membrane protein
MLELTHVYWLCGLYLAYIALQTLRDRQHSKRWSTAAFWALLAVAFAFGDAIAPMAMGVMVLVIAGLAGLGGIGSGNYQDAHADQRETKAVLLGNRLFLPALLIPFITLIGVLILKNIDIDGTPLISSQQTTVICLGLACLGAFGVALVVCGERLPAAVNASRGILDAIGWAILLPLLLAMLGALFTKAGIGDLVADLLTRSLPLEQAWVAVLAYGLGMVLFTMVMGNAFAAFPVMTLGIGLPILVSQHGADPAPLAAIGMLTGYCGTLLTPMAANFNIVPAALLELSDQNAVIRAQVMTALPLMACNLLLIFWLALP